MARELLVRGLAATTTTDHLTAIFARAGTVLSARLSTEPLSGCSRGFGFVKMSSAAEAERAVRQLDGRELDGAVLTVESNVRNVLPVNMMGIAMGLLLLPKFIATFRAWAAIASAISRTPCPIEVTADEPPDPSM